VGRTDRCPIHFPYYSQSDDTWYIIDVFTGHVSELGLCDCSAVTPAKSPKMKWTGITPFILCFVIGFVYIALLHDMVSGVRMV